MVAGVGQGGLWATGPMHAPLARQQWLITAPCLSSARSFWGVAHSLRAFASSCVSPHITPVDSTNGLSRVAESCVVGGQRPQSTACVRLKRLRFPAVPAGSSSKPRWRDRTQRPPC